MLIPRPVSEYYEQRASVPGTLLISEATVVSKAAACVPNVPGIWSEAQVAAWRGVVDAVHAKGSTIYCQLWHPGRVGVPGTGVRILSASAVPADEQSAVPEAMTEAEIADTIRDYAAAASNAVRAGFDGVEIHAGNGCLVDQFIQDTSNHRTDSWGGSVENRARFALGIVRAVIAAVGADRTAIRFSPFSPFMGMLMATDRLYPQFEYLLEHLKPLGLAYMHLIEPRISGNTDCDIGAEYDAGHFVKFWDDSSPVMLAGGYTAESAARAVDEKYKGHDVLIAFGRHFIANPDLVFRAKAGIGFTKYNRESFYIPKSPEGYTDYPFSPEFLAEAA